MANEITLHQGELDIDARLPAQFIADRDAALDEARAVTTCASDSELRKLDFARKECKALIKQVNTERMAITRKLDAFKKSIMAREKEIVATLTAEDERLGALATAYATAKAEAEAAKLAQARAEAEAEAMITGNAVEQVEKSAAPLVSGVRTRTVVEFEIVDADAVPRAYCKPDESLVRAYIQSVKNANPEWTVDLFKIPGITFRKEVRA